MNILYHIWIRQRYLVKISWNMGSESQNLPEIFYKEIFFGKKKLKVIGILHYGIKRKFLGMIQNPTKTKKNI